MARLVMHPQAYAKMDRICERLVRQVTDAVHLDVLAKAPFDPLGGPDHLLATIHATFHGDKQGQVWVGTDHWQFPEYGTAPHVIESHGPWLLKDRKRGLTFGYKVNHPGSPEQAFMRRSLFQKRALRYVVMK